MIRPVAPFTTTVALSGKYGEVVETKSDAVAVAPLGTEPTGLPETTTALWPAVDATPATRRCGSSGTKERMAWVGEREIHDVLVICIPSRSEIHFPA